MARLIGFFKGMRTADSALVCFGEARRREPDFNRARVGLAATLAGEGRLEDAKQELEKGLEYPGDLNILYLNLGLINRSMGDLDAAEANLKKAVSLDKTFVPARLDLAALYLSRGETDKAKEEIEAALGADPGNAEARRMLAEIH